MEMHYVPVQDSLSFDVLISEREWVSSLQGWVASNARTAHAPMRTWSRCLVPRPYGLGTRLNVGLQLKRRRSWWKVSALYFTAYELECTRLIRHILIPPSYFPSPYSNPLSFSCKYSFLFCSLISQSWPAVFVMRLKIISIYLSIYLSSQQTMPYLISTWVARLNTLLAMSGS